MVRYFKNIFEALFTVIIGMRVTFGHLFTRSVTLQYPKEKKILPERSRQKLTVNMTECMACKQCERVCPVDCITIETVKAEKDEDLGVTSEGKQKKIWMPKFEIDMGKCCYCGLCLEPCPTRAIDMTPDFEFCSYDRKDFIIDFSEVSPERKWRPRQKLGLKRKQD